MDGQISRYRYNYTIPKPEWFGHFGGIPLQNHILRIYGPQDASFELYVFLLIAVIGFSQYIERSMLAH